MDLKPPDRINLLALKWQNGTITDAEKQEFEKWYTDFDDVLELPTHGSTQQTGQRLYKLIEKKGGIGVKRQIKWPGFAVAASILLCLGIGTYFYTSTDKAALTSQLPTIVNDVAPGSNKAILTLANGQQIALTNAKNGRLAVQGNMQITKTAEGHIAYNQSAGQFSASTSDYNTITTPVGGEYHLVLADGTNVWLNAASSIKYPAQFTGNERKVEITGEVYFEVAHNAAMPFRVKSNNQVVEVLGTHFNINSYTDERATRTTLLEGSVKVISLGKSAVIKPNQQAIVNEDQLTVANANAEEVVAWKNGYFRFNDEKISSVMRKISRWYNIDVEFKGDMLSEGFNGRISRYKNISQVLKMLEKTKAAHFKVEGRVVTVMQ